MTVPTLISRYQEHRDVVLLKKAYSDISQMNKMVIAEYGSYENWSTSDSDRGVNSKTITDIYLKYLKHNKICYKRGGCGMATAYSLGNRMVAHYLDVGPWNSFITDSGYAVGNADSRDVVISLHVNPKNNRFVWGKDLFFFSLKDDGSVVPYGAGKDMSNCRKNGESLNCAAWVIYKENMDYLRKDVSWND